MPPGITWETSNVRNKLQQVLWLPVEGDRQIPLAERRVATGFYWCPSEEEDKILKDEMKQKRLNKK